MTLTPIRRPGAALALILTVAFIVVLDFSIVNVALAAIERELHADAIAVQWVITAYAITFGGLLVLGGRMGDLWGRRRMFVLGLVVFSLASLAGGLATDLAMLVVARALQGVGAAIVAPAALSLITTSVPEGPARTRALGYYGATASVGFVAGLVLGGLLVQFFDWRAVLWVNVPIGLAAALLTPSLVPADAPVVRHQRLDVVGALLVTGAVAGAVYGVSEGPSTGWLSWQTVGTLLVALALSGVFVAVEQRHPAPLVRLGILRLRSLRASNLYTVMIGAWSAGELLVVPLYLQLVLHYSPLLTGLAMAPQGVVGFLGATRGARVLERVGLKALLVVSGLSAAAGLLLLGAVLGGGSYFLLVVGFMLAGYGTATAAFGATVAATQGVADGEQGLAGGLVNMSRQVGAAMGVAVAAAIIGTGTTSGRSVGPDRSAVLVGAATAVIAALIALRAIAVRGGAVVGERPEPSRSAESGVGIARSPSPGPETGAREVISLNYEKKLIPRVAVIGAGAMGTAMARRLLACGMAVGVWSRHPSSTMKLVELGATAYERAADAAKDADVVISMLPTAEATADVMLAGSVVCAMRPEAIWVQMATIGIEETGWLATETKARRADVAFVDAPVSGSRAPAEAGRLLILASGPETAAQLLEPVFATLGSATLWLGAAGAGSRMKLVLNTWLAFQTEGAAEAAALAERLGVPASALLAALRASPLASSYALGKLARMVEEDYEPDFALDWAVKDLDLVASAVGAGVAPVAGAIADRWRVLVRGGASGLDVSAARQGLDGPPPAGPSGRLTDGEGAGGRAPSGDLELVRIAS